MEGMGFTGNSGSAFAGMELVRVDLTWFVAVYRALNKVVDLAPHLPVDVTLPVVVELALPSIGRGVLHTAHG